MFGGRVFEFMTPRNKLSNATKPLLTAASCSSSSSTKAARRVLCYCASILFLYFLDKPPVLASFEEVIRWATGGRSQSKQSRFAHAQQLQFTQVGSGALRRGFARGTFSPSGSQPCWAYGSTLQKR